MSGKRDFLKLTDYTKEEVLSLMDRAAELKSNRDLTNSPRPLQGKSVGMIFEKPSTRTRVSFEVGVAQLGGYPVVLNRQDIQLARNESIEDTSRVLCRYLDCLVLRTDSHDKVIEMARHSTAPVINGLTDLFHPCQLLADLFTVKEAGIDLSLMRVAWIGDGNNMANSWINAAELFGFELLLACPRGYEPAMEINGDNVRLVRDPVDAAENVDVICTDVWASMGQEDQEEQRRKAFKGYQVNMELIKGASKEVKILHCLPAHRGEEITDEALRSDGSLVWDEAENRLHMQKALMEHLLA